MLKDDEIVSAIEAQEALAETFGNLSEDRVKAIDYYLGEPMGNEVEGRSQVISRDVWDTVEWIKPQLTDVFCGGDEVASFTPRGPEDVKGAEQETEYINYQLTQKNPWFEVFNGWAHDALLQKTGYVKAYWDDSEDRTKEKYRGLSTEEVEALLQDSYVQIIEHEEEDLGGYLGHNVTVERVRPCGGVRIVNVAPENVKVSQNARQLSLQDPRLDFVAEEEMKTISELRAEGFDIPDDISDGGKGGEDYEEDQRDVYTPFRDTEGEKADPSMRRVKVREIWMRIDVDEDGKAELMHFIVVGTKILLKEDAAIVPIFALCPSILPHQHYGLSVADAVMDIQRIKTALLRGSLDNLYLANNGRYAIGDGVNLDDMLDSRPGGVVRVEGVNPSQAIFPLVHSTNGQVAIPMMEYMDRISQKRTGVNEQTQGIDENTLNKTATGAQMLLSAAQQRIKYIARSFAETGVRSLMLGMHAIIQMHAKQADMIRLRNQWVVVDPRQWVKRMDMQVSVGLGDGSKQQQIVVLQQQVQAQMALMPMGLAKPENIYNSVKRIAQLNGFKDPNEFWTDPTLNPPQPPGPPPEIIKEQMRGQIQLQMAQFQAQQDQLKTQATAEVQLQQARAQLELQASNDARDAERAREQAILDAHLEAQKIQSAERLAMFQAEQQAAIKAAEDATKRAIAELQSQTQLAIAGMNQTTQTTGPDGEKQTEAAPAFDPSALMQEVQKALMAQLGPISQRVDAIVAHMDAPREFQRDAAGKVIGVSIGGRTRPVKRGADGRMSGF